MTFDSAGKGAMVWRLNEWMGGDPVKQVEQAQMLGLDNVSLKIVDGLSKCWGANRPQNCVLLPDTIAALKAAGIKVTGWGWTYNTTDALAKNEGRRAAELCQEYGISEYWIDAEDDYRPNHKSQATAHCIGLEEVGPEITHFLCSYRWPITHQPDFPTFQFSPFMEGWAPQVYFLGDNRPNGGAIQLRISFEQYIQQVRDLPYVGVAPTYQWRDWRASGEQLTLFFEEAVRLGCLGVSVWDLPQASPEQLVALEAFDWPGGEPGPPPPQPPTGDKIMLKQIAAEEAALARDIEAIADRM